MELGPGTRQVAAGYILYGSSVVFVITTGNGVDMFVLDQSIGAFVLVKTGIRIPATHKVYSINEAYFDRWTLGQRRLIARMTGPEAGGGGFTSRWLCWV